MKRIFLLTQLLCLSVFSFAQSINITQPNGGETLYSCETYVITWNQSGAISNFFDIDYSLDDGATWASITTNYLSTDGQFSWTVPDAESTIAKIRVTDANAPSVSDISDNVFTIKTPVTILTPNGGEILQALSTSQITWNAEGISSYYTIQYSINGGSSWITVVSNHFNTTGVYTWNVPNNPSTNCRVRVYDSNESCKMDISDEVFTIEPLTPLMTYPNGGEVLRPLCDYTITWDPTTFYTNVRLDYSTDDGTTWVQIDASESNDGYFTWYDVPNIPTSLGLIRVMSNTDITHYDISDTNFSIAEPITIISPNGGESGTGCGDMTISWEKSQNCIGDFLLYYSTNNGTTWTYITEVLDVSSVTQTYNWSIPNGIDSDDVLIRIDSQNYPSTMSDTSDATFSLQSSNDITVTYPNGGEVYEVGETVVITWTNLPAASGQYTVQYSSGGSWSTIASNITGNTYGWTTPNTPSESYRIRVLDYVNTCKQDESDNYFTVNPQIPVMTYPNGGEEFRPLCDYTITWDPTTYYGNVRIEYSSNNGLTWTIIDASETNDGYFTWYDVPNVPTSEGLIKILEVNDVSRFDISDAPFNVAEPITIIAPNGGESGIGCGDMTISWEKSKNCIGDFLLYYSVDNGTNWTYITEVLDVSSVIQTYNWSIPNGIDSDDVLIKIDSQNYPSTMSDTSDATFSLQSSNDITVTYPNGGEVFEVGETVVITWTNLPTASGQYTLQYSSGGSWSTIASNITGNTYGWTTPNTPTGTYKMRVLDYVNTCKVDQSDNYFTINPQTPVMTYPNGGEEFRPLCDYTITWDPSTYYGNVRIEYSDNNGLTWTIIDASETNDGYFTWYDVPNVPTSEGLIKILEANDVSRFDISDGPFNVTEPITIISPNGGESGIGCGDMTISWEKSKNCIGDFLLYYSVDNGTNWTYITEVLDVSSVIQTYNWSIPNGIDSDDVLIKIDSQNYPSTMSDTSDATFSLQSSNDITVTYPTAGEIFQVGEEILVSWTNLPTASGQYTIQYSSGGSWSTIASNITGNNYTWTTPNTPSTSYSIRVLDYVNTCKYDIMEGNFTVEPQDALMTSPNGGGVLYSGVATTITWDPSTFYTNVRIEYSINGGLTWLIIDSSESNDGYYTWYVPNEYSTDCLVKVSHYNDVSHYDISDGLFTIKPAVTILTPNGDNGTSSFLGGCTITSISIDRSSAWNQYTIQYSLDNGISWNTVTSSWTTNANPATYDWNIPNIASTESLIRIYPNSASSYDDISDNTFTIEQPVSLIQPNFGGILQVGSNYDISWATEGISNVYDLYYSINNGASWINIETGYTTSTNTYTWTVPNNISSNCLIRVEDNVDNCKSDVSDNTFSISNSPIPITVLTPNGGETISACTDIDITWNEPTILGAYDITYSTDLGASWEVIDTNYVTSSSSYTWTTPIISSNSVLVRVKEYGGTDFDVSDAVFSIDYTPLAVSPENDTIDLGNTVQLMATGGFGTYSWTPASSLDNSNIPNPIAIPSGNTDYIVSSTNGTCTITGTASIVVNLNNDLFVDHTATGANDGSSWTNAFTDLQSAIAVGEGYNIHIAEGTYLPTATTSRGATFDLVSNMMLLGAYPNGGGVRDVTSYETILSGNVDGVPALDGNSYHVVSVKNATNVVIDGVIVRDGNANVESSFGRSRGGGVFVNNSTLTIIDSEIKWNRAIFGAGLFATLSPNVTLESCTFKKNTAGNGSALYHSNETNMYIKSSRIVDNNSTIRCAIEVNNSLYTMIENSVIADNQSTNANAIGFIATNRNQTCDVYNTTIIGETKNKYLISMQVGKNDELGLNFYNSIIAHQNLAFDKAFVAYNNNILNLNTENCYIQGSSVVGTSSNNLYSTIAGDLMLNADFSVDHCSPVVDMGDNANANQLTTDILGNTRMISTVDMGAFEAQTTCPSSRESLDEKEIVINDHIIVFPNPVTNTLFIQTELESIEVYVYDVLGKRLKTSTLKEIDLSEFPSGIYHLNIFSEGKLITTEKVVKQ